MLDCIPISGGFRHAVKDRKTFLQFIYGAAIEISNKKYEEICALDIPQTDKDIAYEILVEERRELNEEFRRELNREIPMPAIDRICPVIGE